MNTEVSRHILCDPWHALTWRSRGQRSRYPGYQVCSWHGSAGRYDCAWF